VANINTDAILTRIRAVIETAAGSLRTITANTYEGSVFDGLDDAEKTKRALYKPRADATITRIARNPGSPPMYGSLALYDVGVEVLVVRALKPEHKGDTDAANAARDDVKALAINDADVLCQALCTLGNLSAATTGVVSGQLRYEETESEAFLDDDDAPRIETRHRFTGIVQVTLATS